MLRSFTILLIVYTYFTSVESFLHKYPEITSGRYEGDDDPGEPLFLTPYVEKGDIETGRKLASVPSDQWLGVESYAGFFTVDKNLDSNHYFWYFPSMTNPKDAPIILWLNGGPGMPSLFGAFIENGPISVFDGKIMKREITWATNHHMIYVDQPVGAGFSFTNSSNGYCTNEEQVGAQLYSTMTQFFLLFPELQKNDFYIVGEQYAGKFAPALAYTIHHKNPDAQLKINLKGIALGNGWCDPINQISYDKYLYERGLLDYNQMKAVHKFRKETEKMIKLKKWRSATTYIAGLVGMIHNLTSLEFLTDFTNVKKDNDNGQKEDFAILFQQAAVRKSLHVGKLLFQAGGIEVLRKLYQDFSQSITPWISELLDHYEVLTYNGELDIYVAYPFTVKFLSHLKFRDRDEYLNAKRQVIIEERDLVEYVKRGGKLTEIMIRKAGHMVPHDQPKWAWEMITKFTHKTGFMADKNTDKDKLDKASPDNYPNRDILSKWHHDFIHFAENDEHNVIDHFMADY